MRLKEKEIQIIKSTISQLFGEVQIHIFGSRLKDGVRGGDIDIFIIPQTEVQDQRTKKAKAILVLEERLLKPIDLIIHQDFERAIEQEALKGVKL